VSDRTGVPQAAAVDGSEIAVESMSK